MPDPGPSSVSTATRNLIEHIVAFAGERPVDELSELRRRLEALLADVGDRAVTQLVKRLMTTGKDFTYYPPDPLARRIQHEVATLVEATVLLGAENLSAIGDRPAVLLANHLSYSDANLLEVLLRRAGLEQMADRLTVVVGPKVYSDPYRRFSSLCFGTVKTPQPSGLSSDEAVMTAREVALLARETIALALERIEGGDALLIFVEGTRSRGGTMQRALQAVSRYFEAPERWIVPVGIQGSERLVPVGIERLHQTPVTCRVGRPVQAGTLAARSGPSRSLRMDAIGVAIARLLPPEYRGVYAENLPERQAAREIADAVFGSSVDSAR
jgi:1-acyl-sn-glycerol-3-phosphate acyltransferase